MAVAVGGSGWLAACGATTSNGPQSADGGGADVGADVGATTGEADTGAATSDVVEAGDVTTSADTTGITDAGSDAVAGDGSATLDTAADDADDGATNTAPDGQVADAAEDAAGADSCSTDAQGSAPQPCTSTGADTEGPYYEPKAAATTVLAGPKEPGDRLKVTGQVFGHGCVATVAGATVEVWQADAAGKYRDLIHATPLRATLTTDCSGGYGFDTVLPGAYLDAGGYRPRHIHFRVTTPAGKVLITQLYFAGDPYLSPNDSCSSCKSDDASHIIPLKPVGGVKSNHHGVFNIVL